MDVGKTPFFFLVWSLFPYSQGRIPWCWHTRPPWYKTPCYVIKHKLHFYVVLSLHHQHRPSSLKTPDTCWHSVLWVLPMCQVIWSLQWHPWDDVPQKSSSSFSKRPRLFKLISLPFLFHFLQGRVGLLKAFKQHSPYDISTRSKQSEFKASHRCHWVSQWLSDFGWPY